MNNPRSLLFCVLLILAGIAETAAPQAAAQPPAAAPAGAATADTSWEVPAGKMPGGRPEMMMTRYWQRQAGEALRARQAEYDARKTPQQIAAYQARLRQKFLEAIGGLPERTPLADQVAGKVARDGYRVEKIIFASQPKHFVTALLFLPDSDRFKPPVPGVLVPCGHSDTGKGHAAYQSVGASLALAGMAALVVDPIDQGERGQYLGPGGWPQRWGVQAHNHIAIGTTLLGRNVARFEIWDNMRAVDYLQSRPEVDPQRIGCTGNSGGGTQTSYLMALDDRIRAAAPSCYLCGFAALLRTIGPQDAEQNIFGQLAFGMDHGDYVMMRAPTPILLCTATKDFFDIHGAWDVFREAKRLYTRMGFAERVGILENDAPHNYDKLQREGVLRWLSRWLLGKDQPMVEPPIRLLSAEEFRCLPDGRVMRLPGARSTYDLNMEYEGQLARRRAAAWKAGPREELLAQVRRVAGIRPLAEVPKPAVEKIGSHVGRGYKVETLLFTLAGEKGGVPAKRVEGEEGKSEGEGGDMVLPALEFLPEKPAAGPAVLYVHQAGKAADAGPGGPIEQLVRQGQHVLAVDLRGTGQTKSAAADNDVATAYLLGRCYVGLRAEDVLLAARWLAESSGKPPRSGETRIAEGGAQRNPRSAAGAVRLVAVGPVGIPALHAAALEPGLFQSVKLVRTLPSWSAAVRDPVTAVEPDQIVHAALEVYDLPDLAALLGDKLTLEATPPAR
jgi:dienelactone hydrolase